MRYFNTIYLLLLVYTIAALIFWGFSLYKQSERIYHLQVFHLRSGADSVNNPPKFREQMAELEETRMTRRKQYLGEGSTFLLVIFIGAAIVYTSFLRSIRLSKQQTNFMLSVTHELKSPIAAMKLNLQTLEKYKLDEEKKNLLIDKCIKEANRLNELCNNMLLASQMEGGQYKPMKEKLSFKELIETMVRDYQQRYPERFVADIASEDHTVFADKLMLQMAVSNLIENAIKYSPADKTILLMTRTKGARLTFQVSDQGHGVPDSEKQKIFRKFYRIGNEDTRKTKGTGLGLYLTQRIVREQKGTLTVKDNMPSGAIFELSLRLA